VDICCLQIEDLTIIKGGFFICLGISDLAEKVLQFIKDNGYCIHPVELYSRFNFRSALDALVELEKAGLIVKEGSKVKILEEV
jgi:hypothetical protein